MSQVSRDYIQSSIEMFDARVQVMDQHMESLTEKVEQQHAIQLQQLSIIQALITGRLNGEAV